MNNRTVRVLGTIVLILVAVYVITWISTARRTGKYLQDLAGQEPDKVMDALAALRERGGAVGPKLADLVRSGQAEAAPRAAWLLGMIGSHAGDAELLQALQAQDAVLRIAAMQALGQLRAANAVQPLCTVLGNKEEKNEVRMAAAYALGAIGQTSATTALVAALGERPAPAPVTPAAPAAPTAAAAAPAPPPDTTIPLRIAVARALGALRDPAAIEALVAATSDVEPDPEVRVAAAMALGDVASAAEDEEAASKAVTGLLAGLNDEVGDVRVACIHALGQTSPREDMKATVAAAVNKAKDDDDYWARKAADKTAELLRLPE